MGDHDDDAVRSGADGPVLVPVDFSEHSEAALAWAVDAAACMKAPLLVAHVVHDPESGPGFYARPKRKGFLRRMEDAAQDMMSEFMSDCRRRIPAINELDDVDVTIVIGVPATRILELADKHDARLIVMGSQGRTGLDRFLLGSKAQRVAQLSRVPVTIVKARTDD